MLAGDSGGATEAVMHAGNEDPADEFFATAPVLREAEEFSCGFAVVGLQVAGGSEKR